MERKKFRIINAVKAGLHNVLDIDFKISEYFDRQKVLFVPESSDFYKGCRTFYFGNRYGNTTTKFIYQDGSKWEVELVGENRGINLTKSALEGKLGLKFASSKQDNR